MTSLARCTKVFLASEDGATAVEFSVMFVLLLGACFAVVKTLHVVGSGDIWSSRPM